MKPKRKPAKRARAQSKRVFKLQLAEHGTVIYVCCWNSQLNRWQRMTLDEGTLTEEFVHSEIKLLEVSEEKVIKPRGGG